MSSLSRRLFLQQLAASGLMLAGCRANDEQQGNALDPKHPNVLMLVVDDLNDWVGYLGANTQILTPNMDALAASGAYFTRAYCNAPYCNPSRASVLTGLMPSKTKVLSNDIRLRDVRPNIVTLPQHFKAHGYNTFGAGKVFHYPDRLSWTQSFAKPPDVLPAHEPVANQWCPLGSTEKEYFWDWAALDIPDSQMSDYKVADAAIDFLAGAQNKPFFMGVGFFRPHVAWYVPKKYFDLYPRDSIILPEILETDLNDLPESGRITAWWGGDQWCVEQHDIWRDAVQGYMASISFADAQVGRVLDALAKSVYASNTIVVLWSDNGYHLGEKLHWHKSALWEKTLRIPFIIVPPKGNVAGRAVSSHVELLDLFPTLTDYCGLPTPNNLQGRSLRPLIDNPEIAWDYPVLSILNSNDYSLRFKKWRYIRYANGDEELYDHDVDEKEWYNVANNPANSSIKTELYSMMLALI